MKNFISQALLKIVQVGRLVRACRSSGVKSEPCTKAVLLLSADEDCERCLSSVPQRRRGPPRRGENNSLCPPGVLDW